MLADDTSLDNSIPSAASGTTLDNTISVAGGIAITKESAGKIAASGPDQLVIRDAIANDGLLKATGGTLNTQANIDQTGGGTLHRALKPAEALLWPSDSTLDLCIR